MTRLPMPSAMPVELAERLSDPPHEDRAQKWARLRARNNLVDLIMSGYSYPRDLRPQISLYTILHDAEDLSGFYAQLVKEIISRGTELYWNPGNSFYNIHSAVEDVVRDYLNGPGAGWVEMRMQELAEEDRT